MTAVSSVRLEFVNHVHKTHDRLQVWWSSNAFVRKTVTSQTSDVQSRAFLHGALLIDNNVSQLLPAPAWQVAQGLKRGQNGAYE